MFSFFLCVCLCGHASVCLSVCLSVCTSVVVSVGFTGFPGKEYSKKGAVKAGRGIKEVVVNKTPWRRVLVTDWVVYTLRWYVTVINKSFNTFVVVETHIRLTFALCITSWLLFRVLKCRKRSWILFRFVLALVVKVRPNGAELWPNEWSKLTTIQVTTICWCEHTSLLQPMDANKKQRATWYRH